MLDAQRSAVRGEFEAMLFEPVFAPMERAFGAYGGIVMQSFTQALAQLLERSHERG
ncbi:MAG: hypothetical protein ABR508_10140 [Candidatus Baltobacteraceae bacterium]